MTKVEADAARRMAGPTLDDFDVTPPAETEPEEEPGQAEAE